MRSLTSLINASILVFLALPCFAIDPNSKLPIEIESDTASLDDKSGTSTYSGNVIISQGLSRLEADYITVSTTDRRIITIKATGEPAHFVQQDRADAPSTHGYGNAITYVAKDNLLRFAGEAKLVQDENSFSGDQIEYDILRRAIRAKGDQRQGSRVKIHYYPQHKNIDAPASVSPKTSASEPQANSAPPLADNPGNDSKQASP